MTSKFVKTVVSSNFIISVIHINGSTFMYTLIE